MESNLELNIYDDDGFIAIVNADKYKSFVDSDWQFDQLMNHFVEEMNHNTLMIWATSPGGGAWKINFLESSSTLEPFRQIEKIIEVTNGEVYLTNYTDLTMAAQFEDEKIPANTNSKLYIKLPNGTYKFNVRQMFDPKNYDYKTEDTSFEIIIKSADDELDKIEKVFWWTE